MPERRRPLAMQSRMLNVALRYLPVMSILRQVGATSVLDVGCGDGGLGLFEPWRPFVGCDVSFHRPQPPMRPVVGLGGALPFRDRAFDMVVSLDTLEHVPAGERARFVADLARVCRRGVVLAAPCGPLARAAERVLDGWYARLGISTPPWLAEHLRERLPDRAEIEAAVASLGWPYTLYGHENLLVHLAVMMAEATDHLRPRLDRLAEQPERLAGWAARLNARPTYRLVVHARRPG
jgi:SAM-dependent methyltransferase